MGFSIGALVAAFVVAGVASPAGFVVLYLADAVSFLAFAGLLVALPDIVAPTADGDGEGPGAAGNYREVVRDRVFGRLWLVTLPIASSPVGHDHLPWAGSDAESPVRRIPVT
jgi:hypothetical protein